MGFQYAPGAGHYTQVAWAETQAVGCGLVNYEEGEWFKTLIACNYGVGGTMYKVAPYSSCCTCRSSKSLKSLSEFSLHSSRRSGRPSTSPLHFQGTCPDCLYPVLQGGS